MSKLSDSIKRTTRQAEQRIDALDRVATESEAALATAELQSRKLDVGIANLRAEIEAALRG